MTNLRIPPEKAILLLTDRIDDITAMMARQPGSGYYDLVGCCSKIWSVTDEIFGAGDYRSEEIRLIALPACSCNSPAVIQMQLEIYHSCLLKYIDHIRAGIIADE
jgi:hypothetical protein